MEVKSIRYEDMRSILLNDYERKGIAMEKLILVDDKPTGLRGTGIKFLDVSFSGHKTRSGIRPLQHHRHQRREGSDASGCAVQYKFDASCRCVKVVELEIVKQSNTKPR